MDNNGNGKPEAVQSQQEGGQRIELPNGGPVIVVPQRTAEEWAASVAEEMETILGSGCDGCDAEESSSEQEDSDG